MYASANGHTIGQPRSRKSQAAIVNVQRESTISSTNNTGERIRSSSITLSDPSKLSACCMLLAMPFCSGLSLFFTSAARNGNSRASASLLAKSGTRSGCLIDGMQVTQVAAGSGLHSRSKRLEACTNSLENRWRSYLPDSTSRAHPASPHTQSAIPSSARCSFLMFPLTPYLAKPPAGHRLRASIGRLLRRTNLIALATDCSLTVSESGDKSGCCINSEWPS